MRIIGFIAITALWVTPSTAVADPPLVPIHLHLGINPITNIAGDGKPGAITLYWRENGNAWGYDDFTVTVDNQIVTHENNNADYDHFQDSPHNGEDVIVSIRFAHGNYQGRRTLFALRAERKYKTTVVERAPTMISILALIPRDLPLGTPYRFAEVRHFMTERLYCNAEMALQTELGLPVSNHYQGGHKIDGC